MNVLVYDFQLQFFFIPPFPSTTYSRLREVGGMLFVKTTTKLHAFPKQKEKRNRGLLGFDCRSIFADDQDITFFFLSYSFPCVFLLLLVMYSPERIAYILTLGLIFCFCVLGGWLASVFTWLGLYGRHVWWELKDNSRIISSFNELHV